ncbi:MAG: ankyrin repeat domain-containing protein [Holosporales bacterium]|jgi:hypothetical protein|nr:ankyrin repeat domain-containing protein [Holosporales bacterium]
MKGFYKTIALLVSLLGISNISCGELGGAIAIHETEEIGQAILHPIEGVGELRKNGKDSFKEYLGKRIIGGAIVAVVGIVAIIWYYRSRKNAADGGAGNGVPAGGAAPDAAPEEALAAAVRTPLHDAAYNGDIGEVSRLIGENNILINSQDTQECTPLHWAASRHIGIVRVLLEARADKDAKDNGGGTPLHWAVYYRQTEIVQVLLEAGADKDVQNKNGDTPLDLAIAIGHDDIIALLQASRQPKGCYIL